MERPDHQKGAAALERSPHCDSPRLAKGKITVTDGPFSETKEVIGDWAILKTASKAEAIQIAT